MITAEEARDIMPPIEQILVKIESVIRFAAEGGHTHAVYNFSNKDKQGQRAAISQLFKLKYTISFHGENTIKISWRKI